MEANDFIANIKASGSDSDRHNIAEIFEEYHDVLLKLTIKDKASFSLNVLCILCRNLDKVPKWRDSIDNKELLKLSIQCVRQARTLEGPDLTKILACIYHMHKHIVKQTSSIPPELVLKLSYMPFESEKLLKEYCKTYWSILADRLTYIEILKSLKMPIIKLLAKLTEDVVKTIKIYDTVQFCTNLLQFLIKKLFLLFNDWSKELNGFYGDIFNCISKKDLKSLKSLPEEECLDLYVKLNDVLYVITDNSLKNGFNHSVLENVTKLCISLLGHRADMFHCFQTFYLNTFCCIFKDNTNSSLSENILNSILVSCEMTEKLGYKNTLYLTYPFISQLLRLFIESAMNDQHNNYFTEAVQENCLKMIRFLLSKLRNTNQMMKCENCRKKSGVHDALRLSFIAKHIVTVSAETKTHCTQNLSIYYEIVKQQYITLSELKSLGCPNYEKYFRKLQTDLHNTAILLNKSEFYQYSIKLFEVYLINELDSVKSDDDLKNISRALYNKSICELDYKLYSEALQDAFLSLIFSLPEGLGSDKHMSLVIDVKAKALKGTSQEETNDLQIVSVLDASELLYDKKIYGNLQPFMKNLKFSSLLKHEFSMYTKLWPSIVPIAGVWKSLYNLLTNVHTWVKGENGELLLCALYDVVLRTPQYIRTVHNDCYKDIINNLLRRFEKGMVLSTQDQLVEAVLLCLKSEYNIADASAKYEWKVSEQVTDPDQIQINRTVEQEHAALSDAFKAVDILTEVLPCLISEQPEFLGHSLHVCQVTVQQLIYMHRYEYGLHLANICCQVAQICDDKEAYIRNATVLTSFMTEKGEFGEVMMQAVKYSGELMNNVDVLDVVLCFICEVAMYHARCGRKGVSAKLVQAVQIKLLQAFENNSDLNMSLSTGSLMRAQHELGQDSGLSSLSALSAIQRHYLVSSSNCPRWSRRRAAVLRGQRRAADVSERAARAWRRLRAWRRASCAAAPAPRLPALAAAALAAATTNASARDAAQIKIDNRLKYILGLQCSGDSLHTQAQKKQVFTPKHTGLETMRDSMVTRNQTSPLPCITIPAFRAPAFMEHSACSCYACNPACIILACHVCYLESSVYFRAKEFDIARNYFTGTMDVLDQAEAQLNRVMKYVNVSESVKNVLKSKYLKELREIFIDFLIEFACFDLSQGELEKADDHVVKIHEIMAETHLDEYLRNEVHNLMVASARMRNIRKPKETGLEIDMDNLKLSPNNLTNVPKTPETKVIPKMEKTKIVKAEEIPKKRKVIGLNLDETSEESEKTVKPKPKMKQFKIPVPCTSKPKLETITPIKTRSKPAITIQEPSVDETNSDIFTPKCETSQFFTPNQTPAEQFFTPMTSLKTYSKRIVKNLESEFSTPNDVKKRGRKTETGSTKPVKDKRTLIRNTSPGKMVEVTPVTRPRRIRQPVLDDK